MNTVKLYYAYIVGTTTSRSDTYFIYEHEQDFEKAFCCSYMKTCSSFFTADNSQGVCSYIYDEDVSFFKSIAYLL